MKPLADIVVFDFTRYLSGPFGTMILRDLGARVIKIESPSGDPSRRFGPFQGSFSAYFHPINRGKESVVVNLRDPAEVARLGGLLRHADCVVENFRPEVMKAVGLGHKALLELYPRLVYASCSGFGADGPYANRPAFDVVVQAMGGLMSVTGFPDGPPTRMGVSQGDIMAGIYTAFGVTMGLYRRSLTGAGCYVDVAMLDAQLLLATHALGIMAATGADPSPIGNRHPAASPFDVYPTSDGHIAIAANEDRDFQALCETLRCPDLPTDPRFENNAERLGHVGQLTAEIERRTVNFRTAELERTLLAAGVPCGPVNGMRAIVEDPQVVARGSIGLVPGWGDKGLPVAAQPFRIDGERFLTTELAPELGTRSLDDLEAELEQR
jgi:CoA:oxalate CoA-transferase